MNSYHNTTAQQGATLTKLEAKAKNQDQRILTVFKQQVKELTPSEVLVIEFDDGTPITSVRRAFNTLAKQGLIRRSGNTKPGMYGRPEYVWELAK